MSNDLSTERLTARDLLGELGLALKQALALLALSAILALLVNMVRPDGLALVAAKPYETLVPCPEGGGPVTPLGAAEAQAGLADAFLVDARDALAYGARHLPRALSLPYDFLEPMAPEALGSLARDIAKSGKSRVIVYGDGGAADTGLALAKEISAAGVKNVSYVEGGAPALLGTTPGAGGEP